jgi:UDP-N-acetylmuramoyl-L-alanyl-D-glutamate--2,6-diaminopimelate ligase
VAGLGRAGRAAIDALTTLPTTGCVTAWDHSTDGATRSIARGLRRRGIEVSLGGDGLSALDAAGPGSTVIKSPGIDLRKPLFQHARKRGLEVFDELELGWRLSEGPIVGVTGTNGKSTTAKLITRVLSAAGHPAALAGNTEFGPPLSATTTDGWIVCEVSSFQLEATPSFLPDMAVFTNLTLEHLARHVDMENYGAIKRRMFVRGERAVRTAIVNIDDPFGRRLAADVSGAGGRVVSYGFDAGADIRVAGSTWDMREAQHRVHTPDGEVRCRTKLPGRHNASNVAAAFAVGHALDLSAESTSRALLDIDGPSGRWEIIEGPQDFDVVVDFAHNPDGIRQLLHTARAVTDRRDGASLRAIFGPTGAHESVKDREIGRLARALSDHLVLTTGTLNFDGRIARLHELRRAATGGGKLEIVLDRRAAIERVIASAQPGDIVALLGMGSLGQLVVDAAGTAFPFDDRQVARASLERTKAVA